MRKTLEDGGQAIVEELNLKLKEDLCPIYLSTLFMPEEEKLYFSLLYKYRDVFAWSNKKMPGLDPKVTVHNLAIKKGVSHKK